MMSDKSSISRHQTTSDMQRVRQTIHLSICHSRERERERKERKMGSSSSGVNICERVRERVPRKTTAMSRVTIGE